MCICCDSVSNIHWRSKHVKCNKILNVLDTTANAFKIVLYEFQHGTISYDTDQLETLFFNPILDQHSSLSDPNSDLDPDSNYQNHASSASYCNYETVEDLFDCWKMG